MFELSCSETTWSQDLQGERELTMGVSEETVIQIDRPEKNLGCPGMHGGWDQATEGSLALAMVNSLHFNPSARGICRGWGF